MVSVDEETYQRYLEAQAGHAALKYSTEPENPAEPKDLVVLFSTTSIVIGLSSYRNIPQHTFESIERKIFACENIPPSRNIPQHASEPIKRKIPASFCESKTTPQHVPESTSTQKG
jgi:hypothetical protein